MNPILEALKSLTQKAGKTPVASMLPGGSLVKAGPTIEDIAKKFVYNPKSKKVAPMSPIHKMTGKPEDTQDLAMSIGTMMGGIQPTQDIMKASLARLAPSVGNSGKLIPGESPADFIARIKAQKPVAGGGIDEVWNPAKPTLKADYDKALSTGDTATLKSLEPEIPASYRKSAPTLVNHDPLLSEAKKYKSAEEFMKAQGEPVYHGGSKARSALDITKAGSKESNKAAKEGFWFAKDINTAKGYGNKVLEAFPGMKNPKVIDAEGKMFGDMRDVIDEIVPKAKQDGFDGVIIKNLSDEKNWGQYNPTDHYVVFDPSKIKTKSQLTDIWNQANKGVDAIKNTIKQIK